MKIAITGASGLVGGSLARYFGGAHEVYALRRADLDITDDAAVKRWVKRERPELIINCAVAGVDDCERDPSLGAAVNVDGPRSLAEAAAELDATIIHFSTNYVFDGAERGRAPYTINDEARPINVYGRTKLAGEQAVRAAAPRSFIIRTSWVLGPGGKNFQSTAPQHLRVGRKLCAITDSWASATYTADLAARTAEIWQRGRYGGYHLVNAGVLSYYDFAVEAARLVGLSEAEAAQLIERMSEDEMQRPAPRPRYTPLRCLLSEEIGLSPLRDWRAALAEYLRAEGIRL